MSSQAKVVETNTVTLEQAIADKHSADDELQTALQACSLSTTTAALTQYRSELDELERMASPTVRSQIAANDASAGLQAYLDDQTATAQSDAEAQVSSLNSDPLVSHAQALVK